MKLFHTGDTGNQELGVYIPISGNFTIEKLAPKIEQIEIAIIRDILGADEFDALAEAFDPDTLTAEQEALLPYCQKIVANLAYLANVPLGNVYFSEMGILIGQTENAAPASQWRLRDIKNEFAYTGFNAIGELLEFLWSAAPDAYPDWEVSTARWKWRDTIILTAKEFNDYYWIDSSFQLFMRMKPKMREVQRLYIRPVLGDALYAEIVDQVKEDTVSEENAYLLEEFIYPAIAYLTFFEAAPQLRINVDEFGITQREISDKLSDDVKKPASDVAFGEPTNAAEKRGNLFIGHLREYLFTNHTDYPLYESSDQYTQRQAEEDAKDENGDDINDTDRKVVGFF